MMTRQQAQATAEYLAKQFAATFPKATFTPKLFDLTDSGAVVITYRGTEIADYGDESNCRMDRVKRLLVDARDAYRAAHV